MNAGDLMQIVREEGLDTPVLYGAGRLHDAAVVLERDGDRYTVFLVDERHNPIRSTIRTYGDEAEALERVLLKLRQVAKARRSMAALSEPPRSDA